MSLTESNMLPLGSKAPDFLLTDTVSGKLMSLNHLASDKATLIMFICNHCPYVIHVNPELVRIAEEYMPKGVSVIAISSNDAFNYPDDAPDKMKIVANVLKFPFPYLYDDTQQVARAYDAACTPDFYLFDGDRSLAYRGRLDGSRPGNNLPLTGEDLRKAIDTVLEGNQVEGQQIPSAGCNIKWKG